MTTDITRDPFRGSEALASGRLTYRQLHGRRFVPLFRDVFVDVSVTLDLRVRLQALSLRAGEGAVLGGPVAAQAWGAECPWDEAEAVLGTDRRLARDGIRLRTDRLAPDEVARRFGVAVTTPVRTAFDLARREDDLVEVVAAVEALTSRCRFDGAALQELADRHPGVRGLVRVRQVLASLEPLTESLMETRMRFVVTSHGLPAPTVQHPVRGPAGQRYRLDLSWPGAMVALEYDGGDHLTKQRQAADLERLAVLDDLGWDVTRVSGRQIYRQPGDVAARIARKLGLTSR